MSFLEVNKNKHKSGKAFSRDNINVSMLGSIANVLYVPDGYFTYS